MNPPTILCIDDDKAGLAIRKRVLEIAGYSVVATSDADSAIQLFLSSEPDLVISDQLLQGATGTALAAEMKQLQPSTPIIIMSGAVEKPEGMENAELYITKGAPPPVWLKKISEVLQQARSQTSNEQAQSTHA